MCSLREHKVDWICTPVLIQWTGLVNHYLQMCLERYQTDVSLLKQLHSDITTSDESVIVTSFFVVVLS